MDEIIRRCLAMLTLDDLAISIKQLGELKTALTLAEQNMKVTMRFGDKVRNFFLNA